MGKPTVKLRHIFLLIVVALLSALLANAIVFRHGPPVKTPDTTIRARLLRARANVGLAGFLGSASNERYSSMLYDLMVDRPGKGPLPWASGIPAGPDGRYEFTWRIKVNFRAIFSIRGITDEDPALSVKLRNAKGLPLYSKAMGFSLPGDSVALRPGIYVLSVSSKEPLTSLEMSFAPADAEAARPHATASNTSMREINLKLNPRAMKDFKRLVSFGLESTETMIVKMPGARVKGELSYNNKTIGAVRVGLSGRSRIHLKWFPSIDVKVSGGRSVMGIPSFKLYRLETKNGVLEYALMSVLQDMGFFMPRHELIALKVNGKSQGVYLLMETTTKAMFSNARRLEGDILGVNLDKLFFDYPYGADLDVRYFFKAKGTGYKRIDNGNFFSEDFVKKVDPRAMARYIAFTAVYLSAHGLGVDDLRFYRNPASGLFSPLPRDMNLAFLAPNYMYLTLFPHVPWMTGQPPYTVWPLKRLLRNNYKFERNRDILSWGEDNNTKLFLADIHPAVVTFLSTSRNLALVNRYVKYFLSNKTLRKKMLSRAILASREIISAGGADELVTWQNKTLSQNGLLNLSSAKGNISFMWDKPLSVKIRNKRFAWNTRTAPDQDAALSPALFEPVNLSWDKEQYANELSTTLSVEAQIFKILKAKGLGSIKKSFSPIRETKKITTETQERRNTFNAPLDRERAKKVLENVTTYVLTHTTDNGRAVLVFLVRNDTGEKRDYSIIARGGVVETRPVINKVFYVAGGAGSRMANMDDIFKKRFIKGERLRLLVFDLPLADKPLFYRLSAPDDGFFMFPPYMYLPARSSGGASSAGPLRAPPKWVRLENNGLHVPRGSVITLSKTVTLTAGAGKEIFIENGVTFKIAPGAGLIIKSNLHVMGTEERPVRFVSLTDKPWSGLFAGKDRERIDVSVKNAVFDNFGVFPKTSIGGLKLNGGLTILRGNLKMEKVEITNARSEDALNLIHSTADLRDILVTGSFSDGIDMDFSDARIQRLTMEHIGGDGLDLSNSIVLCLDSVFSGSADKGISMGEMSHVVINNSKFTGNAIGIANKDQSSLRAEGSLFEDNGVAISEFIKKPWFGRPEKLLKRNTYRHNNKRYVWRGFYTY